MVEESDAQVMFDRLVASIGDREGVAVGSGRRGFGSGALTVGGRIFAMLSAAQLVVKLPADRVSALIASGEAAPFDAGKGRPMKEWAAIRPNTDEQWLACAEEAYVFVSSAAPR